MTRFTSLGLVVLFSILGTMSCSSPEYIRGTTVPATRRNKDIIQLMEKYRRAMIARDVPSIIAMAHPDYYQPKNSPDYPPYDYKGLKKLMVERFKQIKSVRIDLQYRKVNWLAEDKVEVEVYMDASFQIKVGDQEEWKKKDDYAHIIFRKHEDRFLIISGI